MGTFGGGNSVASGLEQTTVRTRATGSHDLGKRACYEYQCRSLEWMLPVKYDAHLIASLQFLSSSKGRAGVVQCSLDYAVGWSYAVLDSPVRAKLE
jgi:hypothetical protein